MTPPPKHILVDKIFNAGAERNGRGENTDALDALLGLLMNKKKADTAFLVQVLHLVNPNDEIFRRDYFYVKQTKAKTVAELPLIDNADGFYDNLPMLRAKGKRSQHQLRLTKEQRSAMQLQLY